MRWLDSITNSMDMNLSKHFPGGASGKESTCQCRRHKRQEFYPWVGKILWSRKWHPTPIFLPGKFHGQRSVRAMSMGPQNVRRN